MQKLRVFYELRGQNTYEEFEPVVYAYRSGVVVDYARMEERAYHYSDVLKNAGARKVKIMWET